MIDKFTLEDLLIKIMPGGILVCVLCFLYLPHVLSSIPPNLDFLCTFIFITYAYLAGELIQTVAHLVERSMIYVFFKFYQPSEIFLYQDNPVVEDERLREEILAHLTVNEKDKNEFNRAYKDLPYYSPRKHTNSQCQCAFRQLYSKVRENPEIKMFNRGYLMIRGMTFLFYVLTILFFINCYKIYGYLSISIFLILLLRSRGMARTLVYNVVTFNLKGKKEKINSLYY